MQKQLIEIWKPIKNYEGLYEVSNHGRVKSLAKEWINGRGLRKKSDSIKKISITDRGYKSAILNNNKKRKTFTVHSLVWDHFGDQPRNGLKLQVDHIDNNKLNNRIDNLQLLTQRANISKYHKTQKHTSHYTGVHWSKDSKKWRSVIGINGKYKHLGYFIDEHDAHLAYQKALRGGCFGKKKENY